MEKYLSITVDRLKFINSLQFTPQSLESLVKTLEVDEFKYVRVERKSVNMRIRFYCILFKGLSHNDYKLCVRLIYRNYIHYTQGTKRTVQQ